MEKINSDENWHCDVCDDMKHDDSIAWSECHRDANDWEIICESCCIEVGIK
jgi:hypothetical protein